MPRVKWLTSLKNHTDLIQWHKCCWRIIFNLCIKTTFFPLSLFFSSDTSCWSSLAFPQLNSAPRAGHSIITMPTTCKQVKTFKFKLRRSLSSGFSSLFIIIVYVLQGCTDEQEELPESAPQTLLVFGGGDNEGSFFSDLFTIPVEELRD